MLDVILNDDKDLVISYSLTKDYNSRLQSIINVFSIKLDELWEEIKNE